MQKVSRRRTLAAFVCAVAFLIGGEPLPQPEKSSDLFRQTAIWNVHLKFTPEQWAAMEPKGTREPARPFGPGGPEGRGPGMRGPEGLFIPAFLSGDQDRSGTLSSAEFQALGEAWFARWKDGNAQELTAAQVRSGMASLVPGPPSGGFGPEGGGGAGRRPGMTFLGAEGGRNGLSAAAGIDFEYVHADLEFQDRAIPDVAVRYKGNNTFMMARNSLKRSFKIDLNKYVKGQKLAGQTTLNVHNNITDASWMNEVLSYELFRAAGVPAPRTAYARVYVSVPGRYERKYFGLYSVVENIDEHFAEDRFLSKEGAIYKPVTRELFGNLGDEWSRYNQTYDPKTKLSKAQKQRVIDFARLVSSASDTEFAAKAEEFLDLDQFARFMSVTVWLSNMDSLLGMGQNFYVYLNAKTNRFQFLPWDLDHSFGQFPMDGGESENLSILRPWQGSNRFVEKVFQIPAFRKLYLAKLSEFNSTIFKRDRISERIDQLSAAIRPAVAEESNALLARFDALAAGKEEPRPEQMRPGAPPMRSARPIKTFVKARSEAVAAQLAGKEPVRGGEDGPRPFGPTPMAAQSFFSALDANKDGRLTREEFRAGFTRWFASWNTDSDGELTIPELRRGLVALMPPPPRGPAGRPF